MAPLGDNPGDERAISSVTDSSGAERRPTISEVALAADVSRSTVSRVFSRPDNISAATIERVRRAADRLGYRPNPTARALSTGRYRNIAVFVPDVANPFFPPLIGEVQDAAERADYCVFLASSGEVAERETPLLERLGAQVEGMVLVSPRMDDEGVRAIARKRAVVLVNRDIDGISRVLIDSAEGTREAVQHLAELGHSHIGYIPGPEASWSNRQRQQAAVTTADNAGLSLTVLPGALPTFEAGRQAVPALLESGATAVVAFDDLIAQGVMAGLSQRGLQVPDAMSVIGCDDVLGAATWPALTTVSNHSERAGQLALSLLLQRLDGGETHEQRQVIGTALVIRATTASRTRR